MLLLKYKNAYVSILILVNKAEDIQDLLNASMIDEATDGVDVDLGII